MSAPDANLAATVVPERYLMAAPPFTPTKAIPEGWALVPIEPTADMLKASCGALQEYILSLPPSVRMRGGGKIGGVWVGTFQKAAARYKAMVAAAPKPPVQP